MKELCRVGLRRQCGVGRIAENTVLLFQDSVGRLLSQGPPLVYLDVSGNNLGKDFFSRCVGQALKTNTTLQTLR